MRVSSQEHRFHHSPQARDHDIRRSGLSKQELTLSEMEDRLFALQQFQAAHDRSGTAHHSQTEALRRSVLDDGQRTPIWFGRAARALVCTVWRRSRHSAKKYRRLPCLRAQTLNGRLLHSFPHRPFKPGKHRAGSDQQLLPHQIIFDPQIARPAAKPPSSNPWLPGMRLSCLP